MIPTEPPVWLGQESEITALLHAVLDRFDRQPGGLRTIRVYIGAERYLPSLSRADAQADQTWTLVRELERFGLMVIRSSRRNPYDPQWKGARLAFAPGSEALLRLWLGRQRIEPALQARGGHGQYVAEDSGQEDSGQVDPGSTGCPFADTILLPAIREHGRLDQEAILQ
jgi:hypothetical protein